MHPCEPSAAFAPIFWMASLLANYASVEEMILGGVFYLLSQLLLAIVL
jgi:hypothetical protein